MIQSTRYCNDTAIFSHLPGLVGQRGAVRDDHLVGRKLPADRQAGCLMALEPVTVSVERLLAGDTCQGSSARGCHTTCRIDTSSSVYTSGDTSRLFSNTVSPFPRHRCSHGSNESCAALDRHGNIMAPGPSDALVQTCAHATTCTASASPAMTSAHVSAVIPAPDIRAPSLSAVSGIPEDPHAVSWIQSSSSANLPRAHDMAAHAVAPDMSTLQQRQHPHPHLLLQQQKHQELSPKKQALRLSEQQDGSDTKSEHGSADQLGGRMTPAERAKRALMRNISVASSLARGGAPSSCTAAWAPCLMVELAAKEAATGRTVDLLPPLRPEGPFDWALELTGDDPSVDPMCVGMVQFEELMASMNQAAWKMHYSRQIATPTASPGPRLLGTRSLSPGLSTAGLRAALQSAAAGRPPGSARTAVSLARTGAIAPLPPLPPLPAPVAAAARCTSVTAGLGHATAATVWAPATASSFAAPAAAWSSGGGDAVGPPVPALGAGVCGVPGATPQTLQALERRPPQPSHSHDQPPQWSDPCQAGEPQLWAQPPKQPHQAGVSQAPQCHFVQVVQQIQIAALLRSVTMPRQSPQQQPRQPPMSMAPTNATCPESDSSGDKVMVGGSNGGNANDHGKGESNNRDGNIARNAGTCDGTGGRGGQTSLLAMIARLAASGYKYGPVPAGPLPSSHVAGGPPAPGRAKRSSADAALPDMCQSMLRREAILRSMEQQLMLGSRLEPLVAEKQLREQA